MASLSIELPLKPHTLVMWENHLDVLFSYGFRLWESWQSCIETQWKHSQPHFWQKMWNDCWCLRHFFRCTLYIVQGVFLNWCPPKNSECQPVSKFWYLEFLWWDLLCNLTLRTFRGAPVKKNTLYQYQRESITCPGKGLGWCRIEKKFRGGVQRL